MPYSVFNNKPIYFERYSLTINISIGIMFLFASSNSSSINFYIVNTMIKPIMVIKNSIIYSPIKVILSDISNLHHLVGFI